MLSHHIIIKIDTWHFPLKEYILITSLNNFYYVFDKGNMGSKSLSKITHLVRPVTWIIMRTVQVMLYKVTSCVNLWLLPRYLEGWLVFWLCLIYALHPQCLLGAERDEKHRSCFKLPRFLTMRVQKLQEDNLIFYRKNFHMMCSTLEYHIYNLPWITAILLLTAGDGCATFLPLRNISLVYFITNGSLSPLLI